MCCQCCADLGCTHYNDLLQSDYSCHCSVAESSTTTVTSACWGSLVLLYEREQVQPRLHLSIVGQLE